MGRYLKGDHLKIEVVDDASRDSEWMWMLVDHSDDQQRLAFGRLDSEPIVNTDMRPGQEIAVSYDTIRDHRRSD